MKLGKFYASVEKIWKPWPQLALYSCSLNIHLLSSHDHTLEVSQWYAYGNSSGFHQNGLFQGWNANHVN